LVYTFDINSCFINMDEIKIFHSGILEMTIFNFGSFACLPYESKSVILSLPWRSVWRSKGVDEEPLEPVHHMEAYREVLKYFGKLSMNCQSAIKTHSLNRHVDPRTFTFGDDFIGFRDDPEMTIFDKNMEEIYQEVNYKNIQISQSTHASVIGKTIYLTDIATGKVIKEKKLRRDADELHFNCNLLVCVHKIAEHKHVLSVWRLENSSNLKHIKDVAIGEYDGSLQVDEQFIAIKTAGRRKAGRKTYNFISMKTFQIERSVSFRAKYFAYDKGYLFLQNKNLVRILDVASGTYLRDIHVESDEPDSIICCVTPVSSLYTIISIQNCTCTT